MLILVFFSHVSWVTVSLSIHLSRNFPPLFTFSTPTSLYITLQSHSSIFITLFSLFLHITSLSSTAFLLNGTPSFELPHRCSAVVWLRRRLPPLSRDMDKGEKDKAPPQPRAHRRRILGSLPYYARSRRPRLHLRPCAAAQPQSTTITSQSTNAPSTLRSFQIGVQVLCLWQGLRLLPSFRRPQGQPPQAQPRKRPLRRHHHQLGGDGQ